MDPGLYLPYGKPLGWPWKVDDAVGGGLEYHDVPTDAHYIAPAKICDLLRIKSWTLSFVHSGGAFSGSIFTNAGTAYVDIGAGVTTDNTPGWDTQRRAFETFTHSPAGDYDPSMVVRFLYERTVSINPNTDHNYTIEITMFLPQWGWEDTDPIWRIPFQGFDVGTTYAKQVEIDLPTGTETLLSSSDGFLYRGETVGTPDPDWSITLDPLSVF